MAQIKAHEFDGLLARGLPGQPVVLIYGPDRGLVSERAGEIAAATGLPLDDAFSVVRLDAGEIRSDPGRLLDEANSISLFGGRRLIWIKDAGNDRGLADALAALLDSPPPDTTLVLEAADLKKGAVLRKTVEDSRQGLAVPCYADEGRAMNGLIDEEMAEAGLRLAPGARQMLLDLLGGDRLATRGELRKLALYCRGLEVVSEEDVAMIIGDAAALSVDDAVDAVLTGDLPALDRSLERIIASKTQLFLALQACLRQFQQLAAMRASVEEQGKTPAAVMAEDGRRIHFKRKPAVETALRAWPLAQIEPALVHLQAAVLECRRRPALEESITRQALMALAVRSGRAAAAQRR